MSSGTDSISPNIMDLSNDEHILLSSPIDRYSTSIHSKDEFVPLLSWNKTCYYSRRWDLVIVTLLSFTWIWIESNFKYDIIFQLILMIGNRESMVTILFILVQF